jgi:chitinase
LLTEAENPQTEKTAKDIAASDKWVLFPNPVQHQLNIMAGEDIAGGTIRVVDISGRQVLSPRAATYKVDVSRLAPGTYTLIFTKKDRTVTKQFVK